jgi:sortase (surface protein transpeptidase)
VSQAGAGRRGRTALGACLLAVGVVLAVAAVVLWPRAPSGDAGPGVVRVLEPPATASGVASPPAAAPSASAAGTPAGPGRAPATPPAVRSDPPVSLAVPALGVDAEVVGVGTSPDGAMEIPRDGSTLGWYRWGPEPGAASGNAVVSGHVSTRAGGPGALAPLAGIGVGEEVEVRTSGGQVLTYRVVGVETITKSVLPVDRVFARDGAPRLVLITCGGPFQPELGSFRDNVVVVAEPLTGASAGQTP